MFFWVVTQRKVVIRYRRFRTDCPETSIRNYHCMLRNIAEESRHFYYLFLLFMLRFQCHRVFNNDEEMNGDLKKKMEIVLGKHSFPDRGTLPAFAWRN